MTDVIISHGSFQHIDIEQALAYPGTFVSFPGGRTLVIKEWEASAGADGFPMIKLTAHVLGEQIKEEQP